MPYVDKIEVFVGEDKTPEKPQKGGGSELHNSLLSLLSESKKPKKKDKVQEDLYYFGEYSQDDDKPTEKPKKKDKPIEKSKKKDKKKKKQKGSILDGIDVDVIYCGDFMQDKNQEAEVYDTPEDINPNQIDIDTVFEDDDEYEEMGDIIYDQKKSYKKNKKGDDQFKKEFAEELALLYGLLEETNSFGVDLDKIYKAMTTSKTRGFSKYTSDIITSILSTKQTKLSVLKEIASVKKTIADLAIKESKNNGDKDNGNDVTALAASYLGNIVKNGRQNVVNALTGENSEYYGTENEAIDDFVNNIGDYEDDDEREQLNQSLLDDLEDSSTSRSASADAYIRNESKEVKIQIQRDISSGEWEFIAIDKHSNLVMDYPLPDKASVAPMTFTADGTFGTDNFGRSYKVVDVI